MSFSEFHLIDRISHTLHPVGPEVVCGIGDDCAVVHKGNGLLELLTTDTLVEGIHFDPKYFTPFEVGKKAFAVSLSDIAAMGGTPRLALVSLGIASSISEEWILDLYAGMDQMAREFNVSIVGGNITHFPKHFFVSVTLTGDVEKGKCKFRKGAQVGDALYVTGAIGSSAVGLSLLKRGKTKESPFIRAHKTPSPELAAGRFLSCETGVTAMIDISDGLVADLKHILEVSPGVSAEILFDDIPTEKGIEVLVKENRLSLPQVVLSGGEDYQLLFTVKPLVEAALLERAKKKGLRFHRIGTLGEGDQQVKIVGSDGQEMKGKWAGFDHLKS